MKNPSGVPPCGGIIGVTRKGRLIKKTEEPGPIRRQEKERAKSNGEGGHKEAKRGNRCLTRGCKRE